MRRPADGCRALWMFVVCAPLVAPAALAEPATQPGASVGGECKKGEDCRGNFEALLFAGIAIDTFAAKELQHYINPDDSSEVMQRGMAGFHIQYRLTGDPAHQTGGGKDHSHQSWLYARTVHGVRSADVDCSKTPNLSICRDNFDPVTLPEESLYILRNSTSLEAYLGLRYEFRDFQWGQGSPATMYAKVQFGFLSVSDGSGDLVDSHVLGVGIMLIGGSFVGSRIEAGYGKTDLFDEHPNRRLKIDGLLIARGNTQAKPDPLRFRPFAQMTVDADAGHGADSIQVYLGISLEFGGWPEKPKTASTTAPAAASTPGAGAPATPPSDHAGSRSPRR